MAVMHVATIRTVGSHTQNSSLSGAVSVTVATGATGLLVQAQTQNIRYTIDGTTPTSSLGFQLKAGDPPLLIDVPDGTVVKFIEESGSAVLDYQAVTNR